VARSSRAAGAIGSDDYTGFSLILICVGLGILGWASWKLWHAQISTVALVIAHREMQAIAFFSDRFSQADVGVQRANPTVVQFQDLVRLYRHIGTEFLYPAMALVLALGALCFMRAGNARFTRAFDLDALMAEQARTSRSTAAFVGRGLKLTSIRAGDPRPADPALHLSDWIARYATRKGRFDEASARRELVRQLGAEWRGRADAAPEVRCMLAVFALHGIQRREEAARLLGLLSEGLPVAGDDGGDGPTAPLAFDSKTLAVVDQALAELGVFSWALEIMDAHHFTTPGLMSVLNTARLRSGVLAPAQFAFLKLVDRRLWYALHALGFEADGPLAHPHPSQRVEAIGARAHWAAERAIGTPIATPELDAAMAAIRQKGPILDRTLDA
jgi:intracellular multiplication protein IcmP